MTVWSTIGKPTTVRTLLDLTNHYGQAVRRCYDTMEFYMIMNCSMLSLFF